MKKNSNKALILFFLAVVSFAVLLSGCRSDHRREDGKISIVATIFPEYDWTKAILGEHFDEFELTLLLDSGIDLHNFQPTADDIIKISNCDMLIYVGGESDKWVKDALKEAKNKDMVVINLLEALGESAKEEETVEGMENEHGDGHENESEKEYDEHVWLSLKNASLFVDKIEEELEKLDPDNAGSYSKNAGEYKNKLAALDAEYKKAADSSDKKTLIFGDRFPFRYLVDDYGLSYYAAFSGCSAESEASFETIAFLASKADELDADVILTIEGTKNKIAETVVNASSKKTAKVMSVDSMQSVSEGDVRNGVSYLSLMEKNLTVFKEALK